jgi:hypothetical protein
MLLMGVLRERIDLPDAELLAFFWNVEVGP